MTTLVKRNNGLSILPELPSIFNETLFRDWFNWSHQRGDEQVSTVPSVNIREQADNFEITVAAPGMARNDFKVELDNNQLVISGEKKQEQEVEQNGNYLRKEFNYQSFVRTFTLSDKHVNGEKIQAKYADGLLQITIPKSNEAKPKPVKQIQIS